ncbi:MAG: aminotransferase class I/II-fold pyridoxal phosphate-dependent enzyme, partial [Clostridiales bacterium]|nr:aminotransferase class I/II-fold pyridoxal phosphate-dependent enzyme [Clostridiales bacterium]
YPAYYDANVMAGRKVLFADATEDNGFLPMPDHSVKADIIYICSPNNPTGAAYTKMQLQEWVNYALETDAVILYDAAYEYFITDDNLARSIYQVEGAAECAIEICSFSKTAGFTGVRCGYTVVPNQLKRGGTSLNRLWKRRQNTKFNGVSYITQMGASAVFTEEGEREIAESLSVYRRNAERISNCLNELGVHYTGGKHSPYIWMRCPYGMDSWTFFDYLLHKANILGTPGSGFGSNGEGYFRLTAFGKEDETEEACDRLQKLL